MNEAEKKTVALHAEAQVMIEALLQAAPDLWKKSFDEVESMLGQCGHWHPWKDQSQWSMGSWLIREPFTKQFGFSLPCSELIEAFRGPGLPILEVMAGSGYWASQLHRAGLRVVAVDNNSWHGKYPDWVKPHHPIHQMDAVRAVRRHRGHVIFCSWPYMDDGMLRVAEAMHQGQLLFYIGEDEGGCTASDAFFEFARKRMKLLRELNVPQFNGLHDCLRIYRRGS